MSNINTRVDNTDEGQSPPRHVSDGPPADPPKPPSSGSGVSEKTRDGETGPVGDASVVSSGPHLADDGDDRDGGDGVHAAPTAESIALEASLVRKLDCRLMPFAFLGLLVFWLDRTSAALAQATGSLDMDLGLLGGGGQFIVADMIFVVVCVAFAVPGNLMVRRLGGSRWLPGLIVGWGLVTIGTGFVRGFAGLCITRALLGAAGGSFIGSVLLYMGFFYTAGELTARAGIFFSSTPVAGSVGGLLAAGLSRIRAGGYGGWPWIFFVEGAATVLLGAAAFFLLPDTPDNASFLTDDEKKLAAERGQRRWWDERRCPERRQQRRPHLADGGDQLRASSFRQAVLHPVTLLMTMGAFFSVCALSSYSIFLPTVIGTMGYSGIQSVLMTIPPNLVAFLFCILVTRWSQRTDRFAVPLVLSSVLGAIGYALVLAGSFAGKPLFLSPPPGLGGPPPPGGGIGGGAAGMAPPLLLPGLQYAGAFFVAAGVNALSPLALAWVCLNANPYYVRAISLGVIMMIGSFGGVVSSFTYNQSAEPRFVVGHSMNLGFLLAAVLVGAALFGWMRVENNKRERGGRDSRLENCRWEDVNMTRDQYEVQLGWRHPGFRYKM